MNWNEAVFQNVKESSGGGIELLSHGRIGWGVSISGWGRFAKCHMSRALDISDLLEPYQCLGWALLPWWVL